MQSPENHGTPLGAGERAALSYVSPDGTRAVVFAYQLEDGVTAEGGGADPGRLRLRGLHAERTYEVVEIDLDEADAAGGLAREQRRGAALMEEGLAWPLSAACTARIWMLQQAGRGETVEVEVEVEV